MQDLVRNRRVIIIGHADGDGYLAVEQSRRNANEAGAAACELLVDPAITSGYRFWERYLGALDLGSAETIVFVDLMLNYRAPQESFQRICAKAIGHPQRQFVVIDHHPPGDLPKAPPNLHFWFVETVYKCCLGESSELMVIASICDRDEEPVRHRITEAHRRRALGVSRAAADRSGLAGDPLLRLLREDRWDVLEALGEEDRKLHRSVRGIRPAGFPASPALHAARTICA